MDEDYSRDQQAIRTLYAAAAALREVRALHRPTTERTTRAIRELEDTFTARAEQIQAVWN
jgi:hypothetical protein